MECLILDFYHILNAELVVLQKLYQLTADEQFFIVENNVESLLEALEKKAQVVEKLNELEGERQKISVSLGNVYGIKEHIPRLSDFIPLVPDEYRNSLEDIQTKMREITERIQLKNKSNQILIQSSLDYIQYTLQLVADSGRVVNPTYNSGGSVGSKKGSSSWVLNAQA